MNVEQGGLVINYGDFRMQQWLLKADLSAGAKLTYSVLACCAGGRDFAWPSQEYLAEKVSVSVRTLQRYLSELVRFGLIEKGRQFIKGQVRNIYRFLRHAITGALSKTETQDGERNGRPQRSEKIDTLCSDRHDNMSPDSSPASIGPPLVAQIEKTVLTDTTNCPEQHDNMSPSLNKEETIERKEDNPPTPLAGHPTRQGDPVCGDSGKEGAFSLESKEEEPDWIKAKQNLEASLLASNFRTWISPLLFEKTPTEVIIRCPNPFFLNWVKGHYQRELEAALESCGLFSWRLDLFTEEQTEAARNQEGMAVTRNRDDGPTKAPVSDVDSLPLEERFDRLYQAYPRDERRQRGFDIFQSLTKTNLLPKTSDLISAVKRAKNNNPSWQRDNGRYIPQIHKWLSEKRWMD